MPLSWMTKPTPTLAPLADPEPAYVFAVPGTVVQPRHRLTQVLAASSLLALAAQPFRRPMPLLPLPRPAASTFNVTNLNPSGAGSLRQAVLAANANPGADTITFSPALTGSIGLTATLRITDSVQIIGPGPGKLSVSGGGAYGVFYMVEPGSVPFTTTISGLTIRDGLGNSNGAGIYSQGVDLTLDHVDLIHNTGDGRGGALDFGANDFNVGLTIRDSLISGNTANEGGGIYVGSALAGVVIQNTQFLSNTATTKFGGGGAFFYGPASLLIEDSTFVSNTASLGHGGGLRLDSTIGGGATIRRSTISGNSALSGGGIQFYKPAYDTLIEDTTLSGNSASNRGGGLEFYLSTGGTHVVRRTTISGNMANYGAGVYLGHLSNLLTIENSTISGNHANGSGGGIYLDQLQPVALQNSTVVSNTAVNNSGGIRVNAGVLPITNTIVAGNTSPAGPDISGTFQLRYDLVQITGTAIISDAGGNLFGLDPLLGPLANNGGPTLTHLPRRTSPVVNAGDPAFAAPPDTDQRGAPRVWGGRVDIGAVEIVELFLPLLQR
jgi:hypothetical protein